MYMYMTLLSTHVHVTCSFWIASQNLPAKNILPAVLNYLGFDPGATLLRPFSDPLKIDFLQAMGLNFQLLCGINTCHKWCKVLPHFQCLAVHILCALFWNDAQSAKQTNNFHSIFKTLLGSKADMLHGK